MTASHPGQAVMLFDGECALCVHSVQFVLSHERGSVLRFASLQSPAGRDLLSRGGLDPDDIRTFVLITGGVYLRRSDAAVGVAPYLRGAWRLLGIIRFVPRGWRDRVYDLVARNRARWCGRLDTCLVPTADLQARFL